MYIIREATLNDVETIRQLANDIWWPTYGPILAKDQITYMLAQLYSAPIIAHQIKESIQTFLLLTEDDKPVAFAAYSADEVDHELYRLYKLYMLPSTQGKGYGKALLRAVFNKARQAGKNRIELNVNRRNPAKGFYERMGFIIAYEIDIPFGPYFLNDYIMRKEL